MKNRFISLALSASVFIGISTMPSLADHGFLTSQEMNSFFPALTAPPLINNERDIRDRHIFEETRKLAGTARWKLAQEDTDSSAVYLTKIYSCSSRKKLGMDTSPLLFSLLTKAINDANHYIDRDKSRFKRNRPFVNLEGQICSFRSEGFDYPSEDATRAWVGALIISDIVPERKASIFNRATTYGESQVICGTTNASAVDSAPDYAYEIVRAIKSSPRFKAEFEKAKKEVNALPAFISYEACGDIEKISRIRPLANIK